ncbi:MAG: D-alanyl-D-alanine carboxypeptidase [Gammaproteobacteria bacterium]|nr:D-alanyl-D-alanine carboxypeptidase [Gammaproteobacteria bacterium]
MNRKSQGTLSFFLLALVALPLAAQNTPIPSPPAINATAWILMEAHTGFILGDKNPDQHIEPASITKMMTAFAVFNELANGNISLSDKAQVSEKAWRTPGSRMFIEVKSQVSVEELLQGMIVQSGNDASVALAEFVAGSEETFAALMNQYAAQLGMANTNFLNSTGLPAADHYTSPRDIAILARALVGRFPDYYRWYSQKEFTYNGITQRNRNALLWQDATVDGIKTGHTESAGYCLVSSASRGPMRLISVVMGTPSSRARSDASQALLNYGFRFFETHELYAAGQSVNDVRVWKGSQKKAGLGVKQGLFITIPRGRYDDLRAEMDLPPQIIAPLSIDQPLGEIRISLDDQLITQQPLYPLTDVPLGGFFERTLDAIKLWFK